MKQNVSAVSLIDELLLIELFDTTLSHQDVEYHLLNHERKISRKGSFRGSMVQMRINNLPDGHYELHLFVKMKKFESHTLIKKAALDSVTDLPWGKKSKLFTTAG